jgi:hypothetical protein
LTPIAFSVSTPKLLTNKHNLPATEMLPVQQINDSKWLMRNNLENIENDYQQGQQWQTH